MYIPEGATQWEDLRALVAAMGGVVVPSLKAARDAAKRGEPLAVVANAGAAREEVKALRAAGAGVKVAHFYWVTDAALGQVMPPLDAFPLE